MMTIVLKGDLIWSDEKRNLVTLRDSYVTVKDGIIQDVGSTLPSGEYELHDHTGSIIVPGMVDLHMHAPQYGFAGMWMDEELLEWLERHTFPEESRYADGEYAKKGYDIFVDDLANSETTRACIFATMHTDSTLYLMKELEKRGMICCVGKVNMDRNSPDILREETEESYAETLRWLEESKDLKRVKPIITPRFIPSCTDALMEKLGRLARERHLPVQSHLDENRGEIEWVKELCPWSRNYSDAYDRFGMMGDEKTVMAHVVWPLDEEFPLLKRPNVWVAHSPASNDNLASGVAPIRRYLEEGVNTGLATDVAGGHTISMYRMLTEAIAASKLRWRLFDDRYEPITFQDAFYIATRGGGSFFGKVGAIEKGWDADLLVLDTAKMRTPLYDDLSPVERLEFYAYRHPGELIKEKFVRGTKVI